jgi:hypothetical protein
MMARFVGLKDRGKSQFEAALSRLQFGLGCWNQRQAFGITQMRISEEDARTRRDHARRNGSATEYDVLHGWGSYGRRPGHGFRAFLNNLFGRAKVTPAVTHDKGTRHPW